MSDKEQTGKLLKSFGLQYMIDAVDRMGIYRAKVRENKWKEYIIGHHWRNYYEKLEYFSTNENLETKLRDIERSNRSTMQEKFPIDRPGPGETMAQYEERRDKAHMGQS